MSKPRTVGRWQIDMGFVHPIGMDVHNESTEASEESTLHKECLSPSLLSLPSLYNYPLGVKTTGKYFPYRVFMSMTKR